MAIQFEWDRKKAARNLRKHEVSFEEATNVFGDQLSITISDPKHTVPGDERFVTMGQSRKGHALVVVHSDRGRIIRIISARRASRQERKTYEETQ